MRLVVPVPELVDTVVQRIVGGARLGLLTARRVGEERFHLCALVIGEREWTLLEAPLEAGATSFSSLTGRVPQAHWFERAISDMFGLHPDGHPRFKSLLLHEAWPAGFFPLRSDDPLPGGEAPRRAYPFMTVHGDGVYEIPVGPIHAGIIEPGHFRFSCLGEVIQNLEIRLGYQHRGVEEQMTRVPWRHARFLAEAAASDTVVGNALAHALAIESLEELAVPSEAVRLRGVALEIERVASHLGDLGGICSDIGFAGGAAIFGRVRGAARGLGERRTGSRFLTAYVVPGGVALGLSSVQRMALMDDATALLRQVDRELPLLLDNPGAHERMEGTGRVRRALARDFGLVGPAGRACGLRYDVREAFAQEPWASMHAAVHVLEDGDVLARAQIRALETRTSLQLIHRLLAGLQPCAAPRAPVPASLRPDGFGLGMVEAWRGELIHLVFTDASGGISRYCIKDPSFNNWTGLAIAARNEVVADFPLCNKSFGLSYSGNDL